MPSVAELRVARAAVRNHAQQSAYAKRVGDVMQRTWHHLGGPDDASAEAWLRFSVPTINAAKTQTAYSQLAYTREVARMLHLPPTAHIDVPAIVGDDLADRYMSPVIQVREGLGLGKWIDDAMESAAASVRELAVTDVADTSRESAIAAMADTPGVTHYRRVPSDMACDFCLLIAGQTYNTDELAPAHNNCTCSVAPITEEADPTFDRQQALSKDLYASQQRTDDAQAEADRLGEEQQA